MLGGAGILTRVFEMRHGRHAPLFRTSAVWSGSERCLDLLSRLLLLDLCRLMPDVWGGGPRRDDSWTWMRGG